jgi:hypothetical protein
MMEAFSEHPKATPPAERKKSFLERTFELEGEDFKASPRLESMLDHRQEAAEVTLDRLLGRFGAELHDTVTRRLDLDETLARIKEARARAVFDTSPEAIAAEKAARDALRFDKSLRRIAAEKAAQGHVDKSPERIGGKPNPFDTALAKRPEVNGKQAPIEPLGGLGQSHRDKYTGLISFEKAPERLRTNPAEAIPLEDESFRSGLLDYLAPRDQKSKGGKDHDGGGRRGL